MSKNTKKKILQLSSSFGFFGAENVIAELSRELLTSEYLPIIGVFNNRQNPHLELVDFAQKNNIPFTIFNCNGQLDFKTILSIRKFIKVNKIHLIQSHGYKSNFYAWLATLFSKIPRIVTCHPWIKTSLKIRFYSQIDKLLLNKFDKIVAVSEEVKREIENANVSLNKILIIPNGVNIHRFSHHFDSKKIRKHFSIPENRKVIGTIGRLSKEKGHTILIEAAKLIIDKNPWTHFVIAGDGVMKDALQKLTVELKIDDHFSFTGVIDDVPQLLSIIDIFVFPSLTEGLPMALLEAMAAKKPVVASAVGAIPQFIIHNETGLLTPPADRMGLGASIIDLLENEEKAQRLAENGFLKIVNEYTSKIMADRYRGVYAELLKSA